MRTIKYFSVICLLMVSFTAIAQTNRVGEGMSRKILSLKAAMEALQTSLGAELNALDGRVQALESESSRVSSCYNRRNNPGLYLPHHDEADSRGCVSADDLGGDTTNVGIICSGERLEGSTKTCNDCSEAGGVPHDIGGRRFICKFTSSSCPATWTGYQNYREYTSRTCSNTGYGNSFCGSCTTAATPFSANASQPTCQHMAARNREDGDVHCGGGYDTCRATLHAVGCR